MRFRARGIRRRSLCRRLMTHAVRGINDACDHGHEGCRVRAPLCFGLPRPWLLDSRGFPRSSQVQACSTQSPDPDLDHPTSLAISQPACHSRQPMLPTLDAGFPRSAPTRPLGSLTCGAVCLIWPPRRTERESSQEPRGGLLRRILSSSGESTQEVRQTHPVQVGIGTGARHRRQGEVFGSRAQGGPIQVGAKHPQPV